MIGTITASTLFSGCASLKSKESGNKEDYLTLEDGTKIWYHQCSGKKGYSPFVFIHGNAQNHTAAEETLKYLNNLGHPVIAYDLPGHGNSQAYVNGKYSMERLSRNLGDILDSVECSKPILVGHSMGGMIALQYAAQKPKSVRGLVLIDTSDVDPVKVNKAIPLDEIIKGIIKTSHEISEKNLQGKVYPYNENPQLTEEEILGVGLKYTVPEALEGNFTATGDYDVRDKLSSLNIPALILRGEKDVLMTAEMTQAMRERIKNSKEFTIAGYGHNFLIQRPDLLIGKVRENYGFLTKED